MFKGSCWTLDLMMITIVMAPFYEVFSVFFEIPISPWETFSASFFESEGFYDVDSADSQNAQIL